MLIKVTQECIDRGERQICFSCPVAIAINRALPAGQRCIVSAIMIKIYKDYRMLDSDIIKTIDTSDEVRNFIKDFDSGREVQPFEFELCI